MGLSACPVACVAKVIRDLYMYDVAVVYSYATDLSTSTSARLCCVSAVYVLRSVCEVMYVSHERAARVKEKQVLSFCSCVGLPDEKQLTLIRSPFCMFLLDAQLLTITLSLAQAEEVLCCKEGLGFERPHAVVSPCTGICRAA